MTEKYLLLPLNPQQLTPVQTVIQRMSEKHPDFEIELVNTIRPPEIKYTHVKTWFRSVGTYRTVYLMIRVIVLKQFQV